MSPGHNNITRAGVIPRTAAATATVPGDQPCWYAVSTKPQHEMRVAKLLEAKQIEHFLPVAPVRRRWSDRYVTTPLPLFPRYVLVRLAYGDYDQRVAVLDCRSVAGFIGDGKIAWPIPETEIASVRILAQSGVECSTSRYLRAGSFVEVIHGPLAGAQGILIREPKKYRLAVSISLFAQSISAEVDVADVRPC